jgi:hypothetical protein
MMPSGVKGRRLVLPQEVVDRHGGDLAFHLQWCRGQLPTPLMVWFRAEVAGDPARLRDLQRLDQPGAGEAILLALDALNYLSPPEVACGAPTPVPSPEHASLGRPSPHASGAVGETVAPAEPTGRSTAPGDNPRRPRPGPAPRFGFSPGRDGTAAGRVVGPSPVQGAGTGEDLGEVLLREFYRNACRSLAIAGPADFAGTSGPPCGGLMGTPDYLSPEQILDPEVALWPPVSRLEPSERAALSRLTPLERAAVMAEYLAAGDERRAARWFAQAEPPGDPARYPAVLGSAREKLADSLPGGDLLPDPNRCRRTPPRDRRGRGGRARSVTHRPAVVPVSFGDFLRRRFDCPAPPDLTPRPTVLLQRLLEDVEIVLAPERQAEQLEALFAHLVGPPSLNRFADLSRWVADVRARANGPPPDALDRLFRWLAPKVFPGEKGQPVYHLNFALYLRARFLEYSRRQPDWRPRGPRFRDLRAAFQGLDPAVVGKVVWEAVRADACWRAEGGGRDGTAPLPEPLPGGHAAMSRDSLQMWWTLTRDPAALEEVWGRDGRWPVDGVTDGTPAPVLGYLWWHERRTGARDALCRRYLAPAAGPPWLDALPVLEAVDRWDYLNQAGPPVARHVPSCPRGTAGAAESDPAFRQLAGRSRRFRTELRRFLPGDDPDRTNLTALVRELREAIRLARPAGGRPGPGRPRRSAVRIFVELEEAASSLWERLARSARPADGPSAWRGCRQRFESFCDALPVLRGRGGPWRLACMLVYEACSARLAAVLYGLAHWLEDGGWQAPLAAEREKVTAFTRDLTAQRERAAAPHRAGLGLLLLWLSGARDDGAPPWRLLCLDRVWRFSRQPGCEGPLGLALQADDMVERACAHDWPGVARMADEALAEMPPGFPEQRPGLAESYDGLRTAAREGVVD